MWLYARPSWRLVRQVVADAFVVLWSVAWWFVGRAADALIDQVAIPSRETANALRGLRENVLRAGDEAGRLPLLGEQLRQPFDAMLGQIDQVAGAAEVQVATITAVATASGWVVFLMPVLLLVALWLPARVRFALHARSTSRLIGMPGGSDLLALRALATQPLAELRGIDRDPVGAWREGNAEVIARLSDLELARAGVVSRRRLSAPAPPGPPPRSIG